MFKRLILTTVIFAFFLFTPARAAQVSVYIDGQRLPGAFLSDDTTLVPLRAFCTAIAPGCSISWDGDSRTARVSADGLSISATSGSEYIIANGRYLHLASPCFISSDGVFTLPLRPLARAFGAGVSWNASSRSAAVSSGSRSIEPGASFYDEDAVYWLSRIISAEAQGESLTGQIAVGNVVMNRVASPDYPNSIYGVIFDTTGGVQFTPVANGTIYNEPTKRSVIAAKLVLDGADTAGDCLYFLNEKLATSFWIVENCRYVATIGNHSFYA